MKKNRKLLLLGWDAADWKLINPMLDEGLLPNLNKVIESGVMGSIRTLEPPLSPMLWTSIATGKRPYKHGILGFAEYDEASDSVKPVTIEERKSKAIWNILTHHNKKSHIVGWWPSHPAEPINGISISNFFQRAGAPIDEPWPLKDGCIHPKEMSDLFKDMRVHPAEITSAMIQPFISKWKEVDQEKSESLRMTARFLAETIGLHSAGTYIAEFEDWDFLAIYFDAIDHFKHTFMKFHPPRRPHIPEKEYEIYKDAVTGIYRFHDMMLGRYLDLIDDDTTIMIVSDHGFHGNHLRPVEFPHEPAGPAYEHSPYGIFCVSGPGIKKDEFINGASILDITPTILSLFELPIGKDMDGKVLFNIYENPKELEFIDSWEKIEGDFGTHPENMSSSIDQESLQQLIELGYIEDFGNDKEKAKKNTIAENKFYLAQAYIDGGKILKATDILSELHQENPTVFRYAFQLAKCYYERSNFDKCQSMIDVINQMDLQKNKASIDIMQGMVLVGKHKIKEALVCFDNAASKIQLRPQLSLRIAHCYRLLKKYPEAEKYYNLELKLNPENAKAIYGLGLCHIEQNKIESAVDHFLDSVSLDYNQPMAHYHLAEGLFHMNDMEHAVNAYKVALQLRPGLNKARKRLAYIYTEHFDKPELAKKYESEIENQLLGEVVIVTGLPRSGTSMIMQMIDKAGVKIFTDNQRKADENNPLGYLEHRQVMNTSRDNSWVNNANGKCVKVISHLIPFLPDSHRYKVILMNRNIEEVLQSQNKMKERMGIQSGEYSATMKENFLQSIEKVKSWAENRNFVEIIELNYSEMISEPMNGAKQLVTFLGSERSIQEVAATVNPNLYREKYIKK